MSNLGLRAVRALRFDRWVPGAVGELIAGGGVIDVFSTLTNNPANTNENNLWTYTLVPSVLNADNRGVRVTVAGTYAANGNNKTGKLYFGSTVVSTHSNTTSGATWWHQATIIRTSATAQVAWNDARIGSANIAQALTTPAETMSGNVIIKFTGQSGTGTLGDLVLRAAMIEVFG